MTGIMTRSMRCFKCLIVNYYNFNSVFLEFIITGYRGVASTNN